MMMMMTMMTMRRTMMMMMNEEDQTYIGPCNQVGWIHAFHAQTREQIELLCSSTVLKFPWYCWLHIWRWIIIEARTLFSHISSGQYAPARDDIFFGTIRISGTSRRSVYVYIYTPARRIFDSSNCIQNTQLHRPLLAYPVKLLDELQHESSLP